MNSSLGIPFEGLYKQKGGPWWSEQALPGVFGTGSPAIRQPAVRLCLGPQTKLVTLLDVRD